MPIVMPDVSQLRAAANRWRGEAAKLRAHYHGMGDLQQQGNTMAMAFETCADELEALLQPVPAKPACPDGTCAVQPVNAS